jgi:hypothetical protein
MSRVLIWAPNPSGHRLFYARLLAEGALARGHEVVIGMLPSIEFDKFAAIHLVALDRKIVFRPVANASRSALLGATSTTGAELVLAPDGDALARQLLISGRWNSLAQLIVLIMRPSGQHSHLGRALVGSFVKATARGILGMFHRVTVLTLSSAMGGNSKPGTAPDPVSFSATQDSAEQFRVLHQMGRERYWYAVVGALDARKNIDLVATALHELGAEAGLLLAGVMSPEAESRSRTALAELSGAGVALVRINRLLTDEEIDSAVLAADCVFLAHSNEGSSGILGKAAVAGTRVIAAGARSLKIDADSTPGICEWVPLNVQALAFAAKSGLRRPNPPSAELGSGAFVSAFFGPLEP